MLRRRMVAPERFSQAILPSVSPKRFLPNDSPIQTIRILSAECCTRFSFGDRLKMPLATSVGNQKESGEITACNRTNSSDNPIQTPVTVCHSLAIRLDECSGCRRAHSERRHSSAESLQTLVFGIFTQCNPRECTFH